MRPVELDAAAAVVLDAADALDVLVATEDVVLLDATVALELELDDAVVDVVTVKLVAATSGVVAVELDEETRAAEPTLPTSTPRAISLPAEVVPEYEDFR